MMKSAIYLLIVGFLATSIFVCGESVSQGANSGPIITPKLVSLGTIDGKTLFYDKTTRTWAASKTYCESLGMKLGKITTLAQQNLLLGKYGSDLFDGIYWTAGRDARSLEQVVWDTDGSSLKDFGQPKSFGAALSCVYYIADSSTTHNGRWGTFECSSFFEVICETV